MLCLYVDALNKILNGGLEMEKKKNIGCFLKMCIVLTVILSHLAVISYGEPAVMVGAVSSVEVEYPQNQGYIIAYQDTAILKFSIELDSMAAGEEISVEFPPNHEFYYSMESFFLGANYKIEPTGTGFTIIALRDVSARGITVSLPFRCTASVNGLETKQYTVEIQGSMVSFELKVKELKDLVGQNEVIKKVCLGKSDEDTLCWVIYFNYNQMELSSNPGAPFVFEDKVGDGLRLEKNSIAFYHVSAPINPDGSRNTEHDTGTGAYNWEVSATIQSSANDDGWHWETSDFQGFPWFYNPGNDSNDSAFYIYYETEIIDRNVPIYKNTAYLKTLVNNGSSGQGIDVSSESYFVAPNVGSGSNEDGGLIFQKAASHNMSQGLQGAVFELYDSRGNLIGRTVTDNNGNGEFLNLPYGAHVLTEVSAPAGYILDAQPRVVTITDDKVVNYGIILNNVFEGVELTKKDSQTGMVLSGAIFELRKDNGDLITGDLTTDSSGKIVIDGLVPGNYKFVETKAPEGYKLDPMPIDFEIVGGKGNGVSLIKLNEKKISIEGPVSEGSTGSTGDHFGSTGGKGSKAVKPVPSASSGETTPEQESQVILETNEVPLGDGEIFEEPSGMIPLNNIPKTGDYTGEIGLIAVLGQMICGAALAVSIKSKRKRLGN